MRYGELPKIIDTFDNIVSKEMLFYQYLPIKLIGGCINDIKIEERLKHFNPIIDRALADFIVTYGANAFDNHYVYITAKYLYQVPHTSFNRLGWHSDGFLTDDINYIWSDRNPTVFNNSEFNLTKDDSISLKEMENQAMLDNDVFYKENTLLKLDQYNIHRVATSDIGGMRNFLKISFSKDKYDLIGNSHNYLLKYNWEMKSRKQERNIPQSNL